MTTSNPEMLALWSTHLHWQSNKYPVDQHVQLYCRQHEFSTGAATNLYGDVIPSRSRTEGLGWFHSSLNEHIPYITRKTYFVDIIYIWMAIRASWAYQGQVWGPRWTIGSLFLPLNIEPSQVAIVAASFQQDYDSNVERLPTSHHHQVFHLLSAFFFYSVEETVPQQTLSFLQTETPSSK